jgi:hypothetical protein
MRIRDVIRRFRGDQAKARGVIDGQAVKIRDLESKLEAAEAALIKAMRGQSEAERVEYLDRELTLRARLIDQLRAGVVDDAQTAELRRQMHDLRAANKALEARLACLQADNSGIPTLTEVAA